MRFINKYWHILIALVVILLLKLILGDSFRTDLFASLVAAILTIFFSYHKQKLDESRFSNELFKEFNNRYDKLNEQLNAIIEGVELGNGQIKLLYDYFNLCAEEYYHKKNGNIPEEIWRNWVKGMKIFYKNEKVRKLWVDELETGSYYGFNLQEIERY